MRKIWFAALAMAFFGIAICAMDWFVSVIFIGGALGAVQLGGIVDIREELKGE